jgi:hypothetical protein
MQSFIHHSFSKQLLDLTTIYLGKSLIYLLSNIQCYCNSCLVFRCYFLYFKTKLKARCQLVTPEILAASSLSSSSSFSPSLPPFLSPFLSPQVGSYIFLSWKAWILIFLLNISWIAKMTDVHHHTYRLFLLRWGEVSWDLNSRPGTYAWGSLEPGSFCFWSLPPELLELKCEPPHPFLLCFLIFFFF